MTAAQTLRVQRWRGFAGCYVWEIAAFARRTIAKAGRPKQRQPQCRSVIGPRLRWPRARWSAVRSSGARRRGQEAVILRHKGRRDASASAKSATEAQTWLGRYTHQLNEKPSPGSKGPHN